MTNVDVNVDLKPNDKFVLYYFKDLVIEFGRFTTKNGGLTKLLVPFFTLYVVTDPDDASTVLNTCLDKMFVYNVIRPYVGAELVAADIPVWKRNRRIVDHAFKPNILNGYIEIFNRQSKRLVEAMSKHVGKYEDYTELLLINVLETACETTLGVNSDDKEIVVDEEYAKAIHDVLHILTLRCLKLWTIPDILFYFSSLKRKQDKALKIITDKMKKVCLLKKAKYLSCISKNKKEIESEPPKYRCALDIILENSVMDGVCLFTDEKLRQLVDNILIATFDTTSFQLLYTLICIGSYPDVQETVYQEIKAVLGNTGYVDKDRLSQLTYLEAVIKETIRLYPIAPVVGRHSASDVKLKNVTVPFGGNFMIHIWEINRNTELWGSDSAKFRPERWLDIKKLPTHPTAFASFVPGKRNCAGKLYAFMYMKIKLVHILRRYRITANCEQLKFIISVMMKPKSGHLIKLNVRE
ncbi:cytochrome P450 4C1-like [Aphomia sociella]